MSMNVTAESKLAYMIDEVHAATGLGRTSIYSLFSEGKLSPVKVKGRTLVLADDLRALLNSAEKAF